MILDLFEWRTRQAPQVQASDPRASVFVAANAGSGKTTTLVNRVARLLLQRARPEAILCVTYTKAAAAEMQRRLFQVLGAWAVMEDGKLAEELAKLDEPARNLGEARALFARALETPGGIKITTIHAFCERLLKRFPLEAGVSPGFTVLDEVAAREVSAAARERVALEALETPDGPIARAYAYFSVELDYLRFHEMFAAFEAERRAIRAYVDALADVGADIWRCCGFAKPTPASEIEAEAVRKTRWGQWRRASEALALGTEATDQPLGAAMARLDETSSFADLWALFATKPGEARRRMGTNAVDARTRNWLAREQRRLVQAVEAAKAARIAEATIHALSLAVAYIEVYEDAKRTIGALDFGDLIQRTHELLTVRADAAWVLYKLDGGLDHVLLDEAQDTAPDQWDILRALTGEFFIGQGAGVAHRTLFAVGDEKQSIFSFQGAAPERLAAETRAYARLVSRSGRTFRQTPLLDNWRSSAEILTFVDAVFDAPVAAGLKPAGSAAFPIKHNAKRAGAGAVDLWPLEETTPRDEPDPWEAPVDAEPPESANKKLARRVAFGVKQMLVRGETVVDRGSGAPRPVGAGDVLILVRRRNALFHEIIRALKANAVPVGGADRLRLSEHIAFQDLLALGRFARFPDDDLTLAALLRSPLCDVDEDRLFDLARGRSRSLWTTLRSRASERPEWSEAVRRLDWARRESETRAPFDFYARVLARLDDRGWSMKRRFLQRLGREAEDALEAFLAEALAAEARGVIDLERFIAVLAESEIEVKREQETEGSGGGEVRVMTVHGAKGLEAPVVILPDTTTRATAQGGPLLRAEDGGFLWAPRKADDCPASAAARAARDLACDHESLRLLYVALTRARDRLIVAGVKTQPAYFRGSWREVIEAGFAHREIAPQVRQVDLPGGGFARRCGTDPSFAPAPAGGGTAGRPVPKWAERLAPPEPTPGRMAAPSRLSDADAAAPAASPLARVGGLGRFRRGELIHRLLQLLPDVAPADRRSAGLRLIARELDLTDAQRADILGAALGVLDDPQFAPIFGAGSRAEIALAGTSPRLPGIAVSGRVDRLLVEAARVLVADFKTNRPAPADIARADPAYVRQMAAYWALLREVFPGRAIEAALVWTDGPKLMAVPENLMERALDEMVVSG